MARVRHTRYLSLGLTAGLKQSPSVQPDPFLIPVGAAVMDSVGAPIVLPGGEGTPEGYVALPPNVRFAVGTKKSSTPVIPFAFELPPDVLAIPPPPLQSQTPAAPVVQIQPPVASSEENSNPEPPVKARRTTAGKRGKRKLTADTDELQLSADLRFTLPPPLPQLCMAQGQAQTDGKVVGQGDR